MDDNGASGAAQPAAVPQRPRTPDLEQGLGLETGNFAIPINQLGSPENGASTASTSTGEGCGGHIERPDSGHIGRRDSAPSLTPSTFWPNLRSRVYSQQVPAIGQPQVPAIREPEFDGAKLKYPSGLGAKMPLQSPYLLFKNHVPMVYEGAPPLTRADHDGRNRERYQAMAVHKITYPTPYRCMRVDLPAMQVLTIRKLRSKLVREALEHRYRLDDEPDPEWLNPNADYSASTMRQYVQAVQDHEFMLSSAHRNFHISSYAHSSYKLMEEHLESIIKSHSTTSTNKKHPHFSPDDDLAYLRWVGKPKYHDESWSEKRRWRQDQLHPNQSLYLRFMARYAAAITVSLFLILPMFAIILAPDLSQRHAAAVASGFIVLFALGASIALKEVVAVISATAAYAAVLVVFVAAQQATVVLASGTEAGS